MTLLYTYRLFLVITTSVSLEVKLGDLSSSLLPKDAIVGFVTNTELYFT